MKSFIALALFVMAVAAAPQSNPADAQAQIVRSETDNLGLEGYQYSYETSNGIRASEQGQLKNIGSEDEAIEARGQYSYTGPDGVQYTVTYVANEGGFQPEGAHLPQP